MGDEQGRFPKSPLASGGSRKLRVSEEWSSTLASSSVALEALHPHSLATVGGLPSPASHRPAGTGHTVDVHQPQKAEMTCPGLGPFEKFRAYSCLSPKKTVSAKH